MSTRLFIGKIPFTMAESELKQLFEECGAVKSCRIIMDRDTGRSKGFGFVEYEDSAQAQAAIERFNGSNVQGQTLVVNEARPQEKRNSGPSRFR